MGRSRVAAIAIVVIIMGGAYAWLRGETGNAAFAVAGAALVALPFLLSLRCMLYPCRGQVSWSLPALTVGQGTRRRFLYDRIISRRVTESAAAANMSEGS